MSIIISKNLKNAVKVEKTGFALEDNLQQYIYDNPESIPLYDIKDDIRLLILAREFPTASGPIDAIGVDKEGEIYLVETKLYKNPDKRTVVAQVLDYGASLWKTYVNPDVFFSQLEFHVTKHMNMPLQERVRSYFQMSDDELLLFIENLQRNLKDGNYKFVVLMDKIHSQLKDLIIFINQNSKFDIFGVELEYYKYENFEILIPKLFGAEVKKDVQAKGSTDTFVSDQEFINFYSKIGLEDKIHQILTLVKQMQERTIAPEGWTGGRSPKSINFVYSKTGQTKKALTLSLQIYEGAPVNTIDFWLYDKDIEEKTIRSIKEHLGIPTVKIKPNSTYGVVARLPLKEFDSEKLLAFFSSLSSNN